MERKNRTVPTSVKIPPSILDFIDKDVETSGDFANRTDWIVAALREYQSKRSDFLSKKKSLFNDSDGNEVNVPGDRKDSDLGSE